MTSVPNANLADVEFARLLAASVSELALSWFDSQDLAVNTKDDGSPVTQADVQVEARLRELISEHDPDASILGEESGLQQGSSARTWILDPIDGTSAFARKVPLWSTLIALHDEHGPAVGVISLPAIGELVYGGRGLGAFSGDRPCRVSETRELAGAFITAWGYDAWTPELFAKVHATGVSMRGWSDAYGWFLLATGGVDAVIDPGCKIWDVAPMQTIIPEAGGAIAPEIGQLGISLGTNGHLFDQLTAVVE